MWCPRVLSTRNWSGELDNIGLLQNLSQFITWVNNNSLVLNVRISFQCLVPSMPMVKNVSVMKMF